MLCQLNFLNFILDHHVYRNTIDFCVLILCSARLLNLFINSTHFFSGFLRIFRIGDHVVCIFLLSNMDAFYIFSFPNCPHRGITLPTKVRLVKAMVFPVVMYGCESWTVKKAECRRIDAF